MIEIKGYPGYYLADDELTIIGKRKKALKTRFNSVILQQDGKRTCVPINKLIWCALRGVSPDEIPKGYSFRPDNGKMIAETFSDRMSYVKKKNTRRVKISEEQIQYLENYVKILKDIQQNIEFAKSNLFMLINEDREQFIAYAIKLSFYNRDKAEIVADRAVIATIDKICNEKILITNPRGCVRTFIRGYLRVNRKLNNDTQEQDKGLS